MIAIKKAVINTFLTKIFVSLIGLVIVVLISKKLGAEAKGVLSLFVLCISFTQMICDYGSSSALINLSYKYENKNLWGSSIIWVFCVCGLCFLIFFIQSFPFMALVPLTALLLSFTNINNLLLMGNRQVVKRNINLILQPLLLLIFFCLLYFKFSYNTSAYIYAFILASGFTALISFYFIKPFLKSNEPFNFEKSILKIGFWAQNGHLVQFLNYRANFFVIVYFLGEANLGVYSNAIVIAEALWIFGHSLGQIQHIQILNSDNVQFHKKITLKFIGINALFTVTSLIILLAIPAIFWEWLFSKQFSAIHQLLLALSPGIIVFSFSNIFNHYFHATNSFKLIVMVNLVGLIVGIVSSIILIPTHGLIGACWAWDAGLSASSIIYLIFFLRK